MKIITTLLKCFLIGMLFLSSMSVAKASYTANVTSSTTSYVAGTSNVFNFTVKITTNGTVEFVDNVIFLFPSGWTVTAVAGSSPFTFCGGGKANASFAGAVATWQTPGHPSGCGGFATGSYNFTVTATAPVGASGPINVAAQIQGDGWPPPLTDPQISDFSLNFTQFVLNTSVTNVSCTGGSEGQIIASATGGKAPITYSISPVVGTQSPSGTFTGLTAQNYTVTATDADGLKTSKIIVVGTTDKRAVGGRVTLQSNMTATSTALCPGENAVLVPKNYVGKIARWQYTTASSPIWYDVPGSQGALSLTVNGSSITETLYFRTVICTELGICTGQSAVAYSSAFRINKKLLCPLPDGSIVNNVETLDKSFMIAKVYPNPAINLVTLDVEDYTEGVVQIDIMDVTGRQVLKQTTSLTEGLNTISLDISQLSKGIFIVKMTDSQNQKAWVKMVKE